MINTTILMSWDDAGDDKISYVYFGMSHSSISMTCDRSSYKYWCRLFIRTHLVTEEDICFIALYENDVFIHLYTSIEKAFFRNG